MRINQTTHYTTMSSFFILSALLAFVLYFCTKDGSLLGIGGLLFFLGLDFWACLQFILVVGFLMLPITFLYNLGSHR